MTSDLNDKSRFVKQPTPPETSHLSEELVHRLENIVKDPQWVSRDVEILMNYSQDMTAQVSPNLAEIAVMPDNAHQVSEIVTLANEQKIPVIPYAAGANVG